MESGGVCVRFCEKYLRKRQQREQGKNLYAMAESVVKVAGCRVLSLPRACRHFPEKNRGKFFKRN